MPVRCWLELLAAVRERLPFSRCTLPCASFLTFLVNHRSSTAAGRACQRVRCPTSCRTAVNLNVSYCHCSLLPDSESLSSHLSPCIVFTHPAGMLLQSITSLARRVHKDKKRLAALHFAQRSANRPRVERNMATDVCRHCSVWFSAEQPRSRQPAASAITSAFAAKTKGKTRVEVRS